MTVENKNIVFDYRALRLLMGIIALALPFVVTFLSSEKLLSISASYHTEAIALCMFGIIWIVSGKYICLITDKEEALLLFRR